MWHVVDRAFINIFYRQAKLFELNFFIRETFLQMFKSGRQDQLKAGFHWRWSHSRGCSWSYKSAYYIENWSHKRNHKLDGIGVGRIGTFPFRLIPFTTPLLIIQGKLDCQSQKQKQKNQQITRPRIEHCDWFILPLLS